MRFLTESLLKNEKLVFWTRPHWIIFFAPVFALLVASWFILFGDQVLKSSIKLMEYSIPEICTAIALAVGIFTGIGAIITFKTSEYGVTNKRVLMKTGLIQRNSLEIFLEKIEAIHVDQSILGRILNFGTLIVVGTGGTQDPFFNVPKPLHFRRIVQQQIDIDTHGAE